MNLSVLRFDENDMGRNIGISVGGGLQLLGQVRRKMIKNEFRLNELPKPFKDRRILGYKEKEQAGARAHDQHGPGVLRWMSHTRYNLNNLSLILFQTYLMPHSFPSIHAFARVPWH